RLNRRDMCGLLQRSLAVIDEFKQVPRNTHLIVVMQALGAADALVVDKSPVGAVEVNQIVLIELRKMFIGLDQQIGVAGAHGGVIDLDVAGGVTTDLQRTRTQFKFIRDHVVDELYEHCHKNSSR